jgi:uncharacterized protein YeaO (DUF488 family)
MASENDLRIKRVYEPAEAGDGARVLVDRVWPRGVTKEAAALTLWLKDVAPSTALRKWFGHEPERWEEFCRRYHAELEQDQDGLAELRELRGKGRVTLLYGAHDTEHNQAVALRDYLLAHRSRT